MVAASLLETLIDQYKVEQHLGESLFTDVYLAYDVDNDQYVSLHILRPEAKQDAGIASQFLNRAKAIAQVRHPNIARVYQVGTTTEGLPYVTQAYFEGFSLAQRLEQLAQRETPVNSIYAIKLVRQLADALDLAERLHLWHYDLQPEHIRLKNVALPTEDTVILLDLFMPPANRATQRHQDIPVSAAYLSPEQRAGKEITTSSHVYSLGALLFRLLCGQLPSRPVSLMDTIGQNFFGRPTALARGRPGLSAELDYLVDRSLRSDQNQRYRPMTAFIAALESALVAEESRLAAMTAPVEETRRGLWPLLLPIAIVGLIFLAGFFAVRQTGVWPVAAIGPTQSPGVVPTSLAQVIAPTETASTLEPVQTVTSDQGDNVIVLDATTVMPTDAPSLAVNFPSPTATPSPTASPTPTSPPTDTPTPTPEFFARISLNAVNVRRGPGVVYPTIGTVVTGERLRIIAWNGDASNPWYLIQTESGREGWIADAVIEHIDEIAQVSVPTVATIPPTPVFTATPTPTATLIPAEPSPTVATGGNNEPQPTQEPPKPKPEPTRTPPPLPGP